MQKFDTPAPVTTVIDLPAGRVQVIAADRADTTVDIRPADPARNRDTKAAEQIDVTHGTDGVLRIAAPAAKNQYFGPSGSVEITVQLPTGSHVQATAAAAEFRAVGRLGDIVFEGAHGPVKIDEAASLRLTVTDGDITVGRLTGPGQISPQRGDITLAEAVTGTVVLTTQKGDITLAAAASAALDAGTTHGRVHNSLKNAEGSDAALTIRATTAHGDITARSL
ncbi:MULTISPECIES: DUF4097 family beta strand repeat-containing protein [Streptomyces]|uniref:DUF4097 domain-containing protein n=1 Tax=Streptomyces sviceus (strain ATCC 29083 / DSM 924 / JCM 4929 / NBRC 13980 / NCIMB 11184 / NRRL 5439 / UC 5370) TaxID=463191 RepID=B5HPS8_STRX2|nr:MULTISPECIES: DUF4097 family beta strand repeat-containing protein [Streptomyces]EDY54588.1 conserved hypothetical protein [Streptomyces sviceus ATCC 29083]MYT10421.1 DUF4097 family beta strand repeat protein [Streptomyces sp. SID5470]